MTVTPETITRRPSPPPPGAHHRRGKPKPKPTISPPSSRSPRPAHDSHHGLSAPNTASLLTPRRLTPPVPLPHRARHALTARTMASHSARTAASPRAPRPHRPDHGLSLRPHRCLTARATASPPGPTTLHRPTHGSPSGPPLHRPDHSLTLRATGSPTVPAVAENPWQPAQARRRPESAAWRTPSPSGDTLRPGTGASRAHHHRRQASGDLPRKAVGQALETPNAGPAFVRGRRPWSNLRNGPGRRS